MVLPEPEDYGYRDATSIRRSHDHGEPAKKTATINAALSEQ